MRAKRALQLIPCFIVLQMSSLESQERNAPNHPHSALDLTASVIACGLLGGGVRGKSGRRSAGDLSRKGEIHVVYQDRSPETMAPRTGVKRIEGLVERSALG